MVSRKKTSRRKSKSQKLYKMKGCNKKSRKNYLGGSIAAADVNLAYPSNNIKLPPNPFLAYTGKGGAGNSINAAAYPNPGPAPGGFNFLNPQNTQSGGNCGCGSLQKGGCGPMCAIAP